MSPERRLWIGGPGPRLEAVLSIPEGGQGVPGALVCHPHPRFGGDLDNPVVRALAEALAAEGLAVLRFNFRGAGASEGEHGGGGPEADDVGRALDALASAPGVAGTRLGLFGYSFGAWVGLPVGCRDPRVRCLGAVAPPQAVLPLGELPGCTKPVLAVVGSGDAYCPLGVFRQWFQRLEPPKFEQVLEGADHFFRGREAEVGRAAAAFAREWLASG